MKAWIQKHRRATIWIVAAIAVGGVFLYLRSRGGTASSTTATGTVSPADTTGSSSSDYAAGFDAGITAGQDTGLGSGGATSGGTGSSSGGTGGTVKGQGKANTNRLNQILKDLAKPGLTAARRLQLKTAYHSLTGKTYKPANNRYIPKPTKPKAPRRTGAGSGKPVAHG